jgi:hypothetical protein
LAIIAPRLEWLERDERGNQGDDERDPILFHVGQCQQHDDQRRKDVAERHEGSAPARAHQPFAATGATLWGTAETIDWIDPAAPG